MPSPHQLISATAIATCIDDLTSRLTDTLAQHLFDDADFDEDAALAVHLLRSTVQDVRRCLGNALRAKTSGGLTQSATS